MSLDDTPAESTDSVESLIANFNNDSAEAETPAESEQSSPGVPAENPPSTPAEPQPDPKDEEIDALRRVIAANPQMRHNYEMAKYGQSSLPVEQLQPQQPAQPTPQQQAQSTQQAAPDLSFSPEEYDPTNLDHQRSLLGHVVAPMIQQALAPALEYVNSLKQQEAQESQQAIYQQVDSLETELHKMMDTYVPGFSDIYGKEQYTPEQEAVANLAYKKFSETLQKAYPPTVQNEYGQWVNPLWSNSKVQAEVIGKIGPQVAQIANRLGISQSPPPKSIDPTIAKEAYVEGSNAVPSGTKNAFEAAAEKGDLLGMLHNFR